VLSVDKNQTIQLFNLALSGGCELGEAQSNLNRLGLLLLNLKQTWKTEPYSAEYFQNMN
jgi:hypothetical protein